MMFSELADFLVANGSFLFLRWVRGPDNDPVADGAFVHVDDEAVRQNHK